MTPSRGFSRVEFAACMWTFRRVGGLEATSIEGCGWAFLIWRPPQFSYASRKRRRAATSRSRRRPHGLTAVGFCSVKAGSSRESLGAEAQTDAASPAPHGTRLRGGFSTSSQRDYTATRGLAAIGGELKRISAPVCRVMEEAEALLKKSSTWRGPPV